MMADHRMASVIGMISARLRAASAHHRSCTVMLVD